MSVKDVGRGIAIGIAGAGLTTCLTGCDPAPPPIECRSVSDGNGLFEYGSIKGNVLEIGISSRSNDHFTAAAVENLSGAQLIEVVLAPDALSALVRLQLPIPSSPDLGMTTGDGGAADAGAPADAAVPFETFSGSFDFKGTLAGREYEQGSCPMQRTFKFSVHGPLGGPYYVDQMAMALPLSAQQSAKIALVRRAGNELHLEARSRWAGARSAHWSVSHGSITVDGERLAWRLPDGPGLYQAELVLDFGDEGFAFDTLTFEMSGT